MKGVTSEVISEVRSRAGLLEIISEHVVLKRAGKEYRGLCPFHSEKSPSFHVNPDKGIFKCFGCGEGGDVFAFVQKVKGIEFIDCVRELAHRYSVQLVETAEDRHEYDKRTHILMLYQQAAEYYAHLLHDAKEGFTARDYLEKRGITADTIERFKLGYAPAAWDGLLRYLTTNAKASPQTLEEAGLVRRKPDSNSYYDLFRHRLMVPIRDDQGRVIAFGGRTMGDDQVKYLNSPESPIYTKGQHLYAFDQAKDAIKAKDGVIVVEGYFDAIMAHQCGFNQTVAALGTALTERQARQLVRYTESKRVYLSFDTDAAGERAMDRGVETLNQIAEGIGIELRVIRVPGGKDPDECLRAEDGVEAFAEAIASAPALIDYQLERAISAVNVATHTGRIEAAKQIVPILALIKNSVGRGEYIRQWALRLGIREEELLSDVGQFRRMKGLGFTPLPKTVQKSNGLKPGHLEAERQLLALYLTSREDYDMARQSLTEEVFLEPGHRAIKEAIEGIGSQFNTVDDLLCRLQDRLAPTPDASRVLVEVILKAEEIRKQNAPVEVMLKEARARLLQEKLHREKNRLRILLGSASTDKEQSDLSSRINVLKQLEVVLLPGAKTDEDFNDVRRKIDSLLEFGGQVKELETSA